MLNYRQLNMVSIPKKTLGLPENAFNLNISLAISESKTLKALFPTQKVTIFPNLFLSLNNSRPICCLVPRNTIYKKIN